MCNLLSDLGRRLTRIIRTFDPASLDTLPFFLSTYSPGHLTLWSVVAVSYAGGRCK